MNLRRKENIQKKQVFNTFLIKHSTSVEIFFRKSKFEFRQISHFGGMK